MHWGNHAIQRGAERERDAVRRVRARPDRGTTAWAVLLCILAAPGESRAHTDAASLPPIQQAECAEVPEAEPWPERYLNFETPQCNPIALSRRGRLYVVNTPGHEIVEMTRSGKIRGRLRVGLEPSGVAASPDGRTLYVTNHLSDSVSVVDVKSWQVTHTIQQVDADTRLSRLDEPCGVAFSPNQPRAFVTLSQPNRVAVVDTSDHSILDLVEIPGEDPRALRVSPDGKYLFVAAFASGNRTEVEVKDEDLLYEAPDNWWRSFMQRIRGALVLPELTSRISTPEPGANLADRPDRDIFVIDTATLEVTSIDSVGTLLYDLAITPDQETLWVANTGHRNFLNGPEELDGRPIANQLTRIAREADDWSAVTMSNVATDEDPATGEPAAGGAVPSAIAFSKHGELLVTAASSDTLMIFHPSGVLRKRVEVGSMPRGVVTRGGLAWTYNRGDSSVSIIKLKKGIERKRVVFAKDPAPAVIEAGRRHFYSAGFSGNGTFSCASCHPDADTDHLVWELDEAAGHRGTQTLRGIAGTEGFHWDGSQVDAHMLIAGGIEGPVFQGAIDPCAVNEMAEFILNVPFPPSPHRAPSDTLTSDARVGAAVARRGIHYDQEDRPLVPERFDPGFEALLKGIAGTNLKPTGVESCAAAACHAAPLWTSPARIAGIEAITFRGMWDRNTWVHNGVSSKAGELEATDLYRIEHGYPPRYEGVSSAAASSSSFMTTFFRFHDDPVHQSGVDPLALNDRIEEFMRELSTGLPGILGRQLLFDGTPSAEEEVLLHELLVATDHRKITLRIDGTTASGEIHWILSPHPVPVFIDEHGNTLGIQEARDILEAGPYLVLLTADLPANTATQPLLRTIVTLDEPNLIASATNGKQQTFEIRGSGFEPGMWLLVDGFPYAELDVESDTIARHTENPVNAPDSFYVLSLLNADGMQSNEFPIPVRGEPDASLPPSFKPTETTDLPLVVPGGDFD